MNHHHYHIFDLVVILNIGQVDGSLNILTGDCHQDADHAFENTKLNLLNVLDRRNTK